jgi:hypothetical protein
METPPTDKSPKNQPPAANTPKPGKGFFKFLLLVTICGAAAGAGGGLIRQYAPPLGENPIEGAQVQSEKAHNTLWTVIGGGVGLVIGVVVGSAIGAVINREPDAAKGIAILGGIAGAIGGVSGAIFSENLAYSIAAGAVFASVFCVGKFWLSS